MAVPYGAETSRGGAHYGLPTKMAGGCLLCSAHFSVCSVFAMDKGTKKDRFSDWVVGYDACSDDTGKAF